MQDLADLAGPIKVHLYIEEYTTTHTLLECKWVGYKHI